MSQESNSYKWFVLACLTFVYMLNYIDRQIIVILQEDIKRDLLLSDTQLGLMSGLAFAMLYTTLGIPLAKLADSYNRKNILTFCLAFWSFMTILSGRAQNFVQMLLSRIGVSVGEAGCIPPSHSIISDYFPQDKRATALSIHSSGIYFGILLGFIMAGGIANTYGWRAAFLVLGVAGVVFALIFYFIIREPIRGRLEAQHNNENKTTLKSAVVYLFRQKSFVYVCIANGFTTYAMNSSGSFLPSYLMRYHKVELLTVSIVLGLAVGFGGILGTFIGGKIADRKGAKDKKWYLYVPIMACLLALPSAAVIYYSENPNISMGAVFPTVLINALFFGPVYAICQSLAKPDMRAMATAILLLFMNGIGLAFGPLVTGVISDYLEPSFGALSLRYAISINFSSLLLAALLYWLASKHYEKDLQKAMMN